MIITVMVVVSMST